MHSSMVMSIQHFITSPLDVTLVDNTPRLLDILNSTERLSKLLNKRDDRGYTLLHAAAERNEPESLKCLLIKEANPNVRSNPSSKEVTPLHIAAGSGHLACLQLLVQLGGDIMARDTEQLTPVDYASVSGQDLCLNYLNDVLAQKLMDEGTEVEQVLIEVERNLVANNIQTLDHWKLFNTLFPLTVAKGQQLSQSESLMYRQCVLINNPELVKVLSRLAKDIPHTLHDASLLHAACRYGRLGLVQQLVDKVPDIALRLTSEGYNALHIAVAHRQLDIVKALAQQQVTWAHNRHVRMASSSHEHHNNLEDSMSHGVAKFGSATMSGHTAIHLAVAVNDTGILNYLLKHSRELRLSADANQCNYTALHLAVYLNRTDAVQLLLRRGANPNTRLDPSQLDKVAISRTPLSEATTNKNPQILSLLLEYGAEDKHYDAIRICVPSRHHHELMVPLLGSLIKHDDNYKPPKNAKDRRYKMAMIKWSSLQLTELHPDWISGALHRARFLCSQNIDSSRVMEFVTCFNLSNNHLKTLPQEVFYLPKLQQLIVSNNELESLPEIQKVYIQSEDNYAWPCFSLNRILLDKNDLVLLPDFIFCIPKLSYLDVSHNHLRKLPFSMWTAPKLHTFICNCNEIEAIPTNWPRVMNECNVIPTCASPKSMESSKSPNKEGARSPEHDVAKTPVPKYLTASIEADNDAGQKGEGDEAIELTHVSKLQDRLNISNGLLPIEWQSSDSQDEEYEGLALLKLSNNHISEIPENLACLCPKLIRLELEHNEVNTICFPRSFPSTLKHLNMSHNHLESLDCPQMMAKPLPCTNPAVLHESGFTIHNDEVSFCAHRAHLNLLNLTVLEMSHCLLETANFFGPQTRVRHSRNARSGNNQGDNNATVGSAATASGSNSRSHHGKRPNKSKLVCPLLTRLVLSHNLLEKVPESVCEMTELNTLDLSNNAIISLPAEMGKLYKLWEFPLTGLKLICPPHNIIERGKTKDIIGFLWSLLQRARPYHRMKLMLVGYAARGKTTLLQKISEKGQRGVQENWALQRIMERSKYSRGERPNISTVGIVVSDWTYYKRVQHSQTALKSITFMTWDFGGQEEYYATHQCFLSRRSLYLVVWNVTHGMKGAQEIKPWLLNIQARAPHSPVVIVGTHEDRLNSKLRRELEQAKNYINKTYGTLDDRKEGFPQVMHSIVVSCKSGYHIKNLRDKIFDIASQVKESIVAGRGVGCGRIPEHRLLMDQLVPASYLQLEDTVRNISLVMRLQGKPPVLTYKDLREAVFADPRTLISRNALDRELEQAVRFLHDNGTMLHYEDPLLSDLYFVDPQWLCDMLAHIVTVREINPLVRDGVMRVSDFPLIFNDEEFPIHWKKEYIRLLTTFEVAVELGNGELLIPSALSPEKPNLPQTMFPEEMKMLPPLRHCYVIPFIPSGFWPRLISRLLTDPTIISLAREGCGLSEDDTDQLTWVKWRTGMILQYGNLTILSVEELNGGMFPKAQSCDGVKIYGEKKWRVHHSELSIFGINISVPDIYPILKYPEARRKKARRSTGYVKVNEQAMPNVPPPIPSILEPEAPRSILDGAQNPSASGYLPHSNKGAGAKELKLSELDEMIERLRMKRANRQRPVGLHAGPTLTSIDEQINGSSVNDSVLYHEDDDTAKDGGGLKPSAAKSTGSIRRARSSEGLSQLAGAAAGNHSSGNKQPQQQEKQQLSPEANSVLSSVAAAVASKTPIIDEEKNDIMRAGLMSKVFDHISLLVEDWFVGVRPRTSVIPCPFCSENTARDMAQLRRSFSDNPVLLSPEERVERGLPADLEQQPADAAQASLQENPPPSEASSTAVFSMDPNFSITASVPSSLGATRSNKHSRQDHLGDMKSERTHTRMQTSPRTSRQHSRKYCYSFKHQECIVTARTQDTMKCPDHGDILLSYMAPDTMFMTEGHDILMKSDKLQRGESIGKGAFATVYKAKMKKTSDKGEEEIDVAFKALTKEWRFQDADQDHSIEDTVDPDTQSVFSRNADVTRRSIIDGFFGVKKELSILSPLKHPHIIQLHGVMMRPLGLILELAPLGSIKDMLRDYSEAHAHLHISVTKQVVVQVAGALQYLHDNKIIYRDLKSDNVLVWKFPDAQDPIPVYGTTNVLVKLSDYGISQFVATQGARGLVGTPGFMAPEMLKYQGKEVYNCQIDIFSFAMFMYELITLHVPYVDLNAQQANQANEKGERPSLKRKDFPCPVLLRELMVWCWQENPDDRPTGNEIIEKCNTLHFPKLLDGIRVCDAGQVTATCARVITGYQPTFRHRKSHHIMSPPPFNPSLGSSTGAATPPLLKKVTEEESGLYSNKPTSIHVYSEANGITYRSSGVSPRSSGIISSHMDRRESGGSLLSATPNLRTMAGDSAYASSRVSEVSETEMSKPSPKPTSKEFPISPTTEASISAPHTEAGNQSTDINRRTTSSTASATPPFLTPSHQPRFSSDEPRSKYRWSPRMGEQYSPASFSDDEQPTFELWVATSNARHSVATIIDYSGKFTNIEDVEVGDSPVLSMCVVRDKVWMGFEIGYLMMFDTTSKRPHVQIWVKQYKKILSIVHIASLRKVYLGLDDGSVLMYNDELPSGLTTQFPACITLDPLMAYMDSTQTSSCLLAIPRIDSASVAGAGSEANPPLQSMSDRSLNSLDLQPPSFNVEQPRGPQSSGPIYELWVGQKNGLITILNAETLEVITFIQNPLDLSRVPSYVAYLSYAHLIYGVNSESVGGGVAGGYPDGSGGATALPDVVSVYGALYHGQYVTRWNTEDKTARDSFNCEEHLERGEECNITALHYSQLQLYVGLKSGKILIMNALNFNLLCFLDCHRGTVSSFLSLNLALLQQQLDTAGGDFPSSLIRTNSEASILHSSEGPSPLLSILRRSSSLGSLSPTSHFNQLLSFGNGFRSYYDGTEAQNQMDAGFMLVWESDDWTRTY